MKPVSLSWASYIKFGLGRRASLVGERFGINWLTYNPIVFRLFHDNAVRSAPSVIRVIRRAFPEAASYVDVGAGSCAYAAEAARQGLRISACEHNPIGRRWGAKQGVKAHPFDLTNDPPSTLTGPFDLSYCFEVAEHLPPALGHRLVQFIAGLAKIAIFTAAAPGQGGTGHINEQPKSYWIERFESAGMQFLPDKTEELATGFHQDEIAATWLRTNVIAFTRRSPAEGNA